MKIYDCPDADITVWSRLEAFALRTVRLRHHGLCLGRRATSSQRLPPRVKTLMRQSNHRAEAGSYVPLLRGPCRRLPHERLLPRG